MQKAEPSVDRLGQILEAKRREVEERRAHADLAALEQAARGHIRRPFASSLVRSKRAIIAEMKQRSPSKGLLRENYQPEALSQAYHRAGACALAAFA